MNKYFIVCITLFFSIIILFFYLSSKWEVPIKSTSINNICQKNKYWKLEEKGLLSDKIKAKKYVVDNIPEINTAENLLITTDLNELKKFRFPDKFVMKCSSGARMFQIVVDKFDIQELLSNAKKFLNSNYAYQNYRKLTVLGLEEPQYQYNQKAIMIEEYLEDAQELRVMLINGKISYYEYIIDKKEIIYDEKWKKLDNNKKTLEKPSYIDKINSCCNKFYNDFFIDLVRVDFLISNNNIYFGEFTFTPENCRKKYENKLNELMVSKIQKY